MMSSYSRKATGSRLTAWWSRPRTSPSTSRSLTGESVPVRKTAADGSPTLQPPGGDDLPFVYSGTLVIHGHGLACAMATGSRTALGKIGKALEAVAPEETPLQAETRRVVQRLAVAGVFLCVVVAILYGLIWGHWLDSFLASLTLAMAIIPTSFRWC